MEHIIDYLKDRLVSLTNENDQFISIQQPTTDEMTAHFYNSQKIVLYNSYCELSDSSLIPIEIKQDTFNFLKARFVDSCNSVTEYINRIVSSIAQFNQRLESITFQAENFEDNIKAIDDVQKEKMLYLENLEIDLFQPNPLFEMGIILPETLILPDNSAKYDSSASIPTKSKKRNLPVQKNKGKQSKKNLSNEKVILGLQDLKLTGSINLEKLYGIDNCWYAPSEIDKDCTNASFVQEHATVLVGAKKFSNKKGKLIQNSTAFIKKSDKSLLSVGAGLAATQKISRGDALFVFQGKVQNYDEYKKEVKNNLTKPYYAHYYGKTGGKDGGKVKILNCYDEYLKGNCLASMVNSATHLVNAKGQTIKPNCRIIRNKGKIYLRAITDIDINDEFFCCYGKNFDYQGAENDLLTNKNLSSCCSSTYDPLLPTYTTHNNSSGRSVISISTTSSRSSSPTSSMSA